MYIELRSTFKKKKVKQSLLQSSSIIYKSFLMSVEVKICEKKIYVNNVESKEDMLMCAEC